MTFHLIPILILAQVTDPGQVLPLILQGLSAHNYWLALPGIVWVATWAVRRYGANFVPWFATNLGGLVLAFVLSLAGAFIDTAVTAPAWSLAIVLGLVFKVAVGFFGSMGIQSGQKTVAESSQPKVAG